MSSTYILGSQCDKQFGRSLIYSKNNNGPKIVPWGMLQRKTRLLDSDPLVEIFVFDSLNKIQTIDMHYPIIRSFSVLIIESYGQQYRKPFLSQEKELR